MTGSQLTITARTLAEKGDATKKAVEALWRDKAAEAETEVAELLASLAEAAGTWRDQATSQMVVALKRRMDEGRDVAPEDFNHWLQAHGAEPEVVLDLVELNPPSEVRVLARMSQIGSQKVVYDSQWKAGRAVVLKRFSDRKDAEHLLERELRPHPFAMTHPNIIETHVLQNTDGEPFLVERKLAVVLNDSWEAAGVTESANLLHDLALALHFLSDRGLVHGDIKPDNLGFEWSRYILLDFGICRPVADFEGNGSATGSLRTRAPELLSGGKHSFASDVWGLGATVFNSLIKAFPLFTRGEQVPRVSAPGERTEKEEELATRATEDYDEWVFKRLHEGVRHEGLRSVLTAALAPGPDERPSAEELAEICRSKLVSFIRASSRDRDLVIDTRLEQMDAYLPRRDLYARLPPRKRIELQSALDELAYADLDESQRVILAGLKNRFDEHT